MSSTVLLNQADSKSAMRVKISIAIAVLYGGILAISWIISLSDYNRQMHWAAANFSGYDLAGLFSQPTVIYGLHELHGANQDKLASALLFFTFGVAMALGQSTLTAAFVGGISMIGALAFLFNASQHLSSVLQMEMTNPSGMFPTVAPSSQVFPLLLVAVCIGLTWPIFVKLGALRKLEQLNLNEKKLLVPAGSLIVVAVVAAFI